MYKTYFDEQIEKVSKGKYSISELQEQYFPKLEKKTLYQSLKRKGFESEKVMFKGHIVYLYIIK